MAPAADVPFHLREAGSDVILEAEGANAGEAFVALAQAFTHVTTSGDRLQPQEAIPLDVHTPADPARLMVAFIDELVFLFATRGFLPVEGDLKVSLTPPGARVTGTLRGERFDPARHRLGTEIKAATLHDARLDISPKRARAIVQVDL